MNQKPLKKSKSFYESPDAQSTAHTNRLFISDEGKPAAGGCNVGCGCKGENTQIQIFELVAAFGVMGPNASAMHMNFGQRVQSSEGCKVPRNVVVQQEALLQHPRLLQASVFCALRRLVNPMLELKTHESAQHQKSKDLIHFHC